MARKIVLRTLSAIYGVSALFLIIYIRQHTNIFQMDFSGQIASAQLFANNWLHGRSMNWFSWLINNLFYPPLQDFIVYIIHLVGWLTVYHAFLVYLTLLIVAYFWSFVLIASRFKKRYLILFYGIGGLMFLWVNKVFNPEAWLYLLWLGTSDIVVIGLISEILGCVFLQLLLFELLGKKRSFVLTLFACLAFLSHLVVGPVAMLILFLYFAFHRPRNWIRYILWALGITAFFWVPLVVYKSLLITSNVIHRLPEFTLLALLLSLFLANRKSPVFIIALVGTLIVLPPIVDPVLSFFSLQWTSILPSFHYYRFGSIGVVLALVSFVGMLNEYVIYKLHTKYNKKFAALVVLLCLFCLGRYFGVWYGWMEWWDVVIQQLWPNNVPTAADLALFKNIDQDKRILTIDMKRAGDNAIDSLDQYLWYQNNFVKGLYRESSKSNQLLISYLANILSPDDLPFVSFKLGPIDASWYNNLRSHFVNDYNIGYVLMGPLSPYESYMTENNYSHLVSLLGSGSADLAFSREGTMFLNSYNYTLYKVHPKTWSKVVNTIASVVSEVPKKLYIHSKTFHAGDILNTYNSHFRVFLTKLSTTYLWRNIVNEHNFPFLAASWYTAYMIIDKDSSVSIPPIVPSSWDVSFLKENDYRYKLVLTGSTSSWVQVKIAPLPWWHMEDEKWNVVPLYRLPYATYAQIKGTAYMIYERTWVMWLWYCISLITWILALYFVISYSRSKVKDA